jgi:cysteine desulfurase / selenocysteine lyase
VNIDEFRSLFPITRERAYLFSGAIAPSNERTEAALEEWARLWRSRPLLSYDAAVEQIEALRAAIARLLGVRATRVSISDNTSRASNTAVRLVRCPSGANVVFDETTYPSSRYPWLSLTAAAPRVAVGNPGERRSDAVIRCIDRDTVAVSISHVAPLTGVRHDLRAIADAAHRHGAVLIVDIAQTAGVVPISLDDDGVDMAVGTTMKWLLGPPGVGFLALRDEDLRETSGVDLGYMALDVAGEEWPQDALPPLWPDGRRLELGMPSLPVLNPAVAGIDLLLELGVSTVHRQVEALVGRCLEGLSDLGVEVRTPVDPADRAGVVAFEHPHAQELARRLAEDGVDIGGYDYGLGRVDPHAFNTVEDIDRFLDGVRRFSAPG